MNYPSSYFASSLRKFCYKLYHFTQIINVELTERHMYITLHNSSIYNVIQQWCMKSPLKYQTANIAYNSNMYA